MLRAGARYEFTHGLTTDTLAWRFEFMSSTEAVDSHFVVEQGAFAPRDVPDLEVTAGSNRVISSYVKQLRLEMNSGSMKYANWLAELIKAESVPPVPSDPDQAALIAAKAAKFGVRSPRFERCLRLVSRNDGVSGPRRFRAASASRFLG